MFVQRFWGIRIGHHIATQLSKRGARLAAFVEKKPTLEFVNSQTDVNYEYILSYEQIMNDPGQFVDDNVSLDFICQDLGIDSIWPLATTEHNLARSYAGRYYYEDVQNKDDDFIVAYMKAFYCEARRLFDAFQPDIIISPNFVAPHHLIVERMAKNDGIRMVAVSSTRIDGIYSFCYDYKNTDGPFIRRVKHLQQCKSTSKNAKKAGDYINRFRSNYAQPLYQQRIAEKLNKYRLSHEVARALKWSVIYLIKGGINPMPNIGPTPDNISPRYLFRDLFMEWKYRREADNFEYTPHESLGRFAYFPLQMQPEALIDTIAGYFNNQFEVARLTAKSLPGDMTLAVKEHPSMLGKRGRRFYENLSRTPNVKVVDYRVPSSELLQRCDLIVSPGGTTVIEGAYFHKPAIQFSDVGVTQLLPNVVRHSEFPSLPARIREVLSARPDLEEYEFRLNCFVAGALDLGFDVDYDGLWVYGYEIDLNELYKHFEAVVLQCCHETRRSENYDGGGLNVPASL